MTGAPTETESPLHKCPYIEGLGRRADPAESHNRKDPKALGAKMSLDFRLLRTHSVRTLLVRSHWWQARDGRSGKRSKHGPGRWPHSRQRSGSRTLRSLDSTPAPGRRGPSICARWRRHWMQQLDGAHEQHAHCEGRSESPTVAPGARASRHTVLRKHAGGARLQRSIQGCGSVIRRRGDRAGHRPLPRRRETLSVA